MIEKGVVIGITPDSVQIRMDTANHCEGCNLCNVMGKNGMVMELPPRPDLNTGDKVQVEIPEASLVKVSLLLFIFPIISFAAGVILTDMVAQHFWNKTLEQGYQLVAGILSMIVSFIVLYIFNRRARKRKNLEPRIVRIENPG